jgi:XTP/dITP diphosphohydrolase
MRIVLASNNSGKIRELRELLKHLQLEVIPQADLNVPEIAETGLSFIENAIIKARHAAQMTGLPALADDSGLAVPALQGAPGIYSARYAGEHATSADNIRKLLTEMIDLPAENRAASFHCVLVFMTHEHDPTPLVCDGKWTGSILREPRGADGFGYDPVFYDPASRQSAAELPLAIKNKISHRGIALQSLLKLLPEKL